MPRLFNREHHWIQHLDAFASNPCEKLGLATLVESDDARSPGDLARDTEPGGRMLAFVRRGSWPGAAGPPAAIARYTSRLRVALFAPLRLCVVFVLAGVAREPRGMRHFLSMMAGGFR
jgi:hypothetical protein